MSEERNPTPPTALPDSPPVDELASAATVSGEHRLHETPLPADAITVETERYQLLEVLGRGGMGEVRKAFDPRLNRHVALKIMRHASPELAKRLVQEARSQARVEHENICKVYGVGELAGQPFIALQYVAGKTLRQAAAEMTREERIQVMKTVAEALHAAHRLGLIHRDVKPANILVERQESGAWKPYVADFGIAREIEAPGATSTGLALGTPLYMAPEQARGETQKLDRRTDVYGLGATLYELLGGRPPFDGQTALTIILKVLHEEPPPLRAVDPSIPADLETIVGKCMEKNPAQRYETAKALADDLQCYLDGEPIHARRASITYRLAKRAKKNLGLVIAGSVALVAAITLGSYAIYAQRTAAEQARLARRFGQEVEKIDALSRYAALLPLHDTRREQQAIRAKMDAIETAMRALGDVAVGPGQSALGRGYLALGKIEEARVHLERAWQGGYRTVETASALGESLGELYRKALVEESRTDDRQLAFQRKAELAKRYRDPALGYLKHQERGEDQAPEYVEGLIALYEQRYDEALQKAKQAVARAPWLHEALTLQGDIYLLRGKELSLKGEIEPALAELRRAGDAYHVAAETAHSSVAAFEGDCQRLIEMVAIEVDRDIAPDGDVQKGIAACDAALVAQPDDPDILDEEAHLIHDLARYQSAHAIDPETALKRSIALTERALKVDPHNARAHQVMGLGYSTLASWKMDKGEDTRVMMQQALECAQRALKADPRLYDGYELASTIYGTRGDWEAAHGIDPRASFSASIEYGQKSIQFAPGGFKGHNAVGIAYWNTAVYELTTGLDPRPSLDRALAHYDQVIAANPNVDYGYTNACGAWQTLAEYQTQLGLDPSAALDKAIETCKKALSVDVNYAGSHLNLGCAWFDRAVWQLDQSIDPTPTLDLARREMTRAIEIDKDYVFGFRYRGEIELVAARWALAHNGTAAPFLVAAEAAFRRADALNPKDPEIARELADLHRWRAAYRLQQKQPIDADLRDGLANAERALGLNARLGTAVLAQAGLHVAAAKAAQAPSVRTAAIDRARATVKRAIELNHNLERQARALFAEAEALLPTK